MLYYEIGSANLEFDSDDLKKGLFESLDKMCKMQKVLTLAVNVLRPKLKVSKV